MADLSWSHILIVLLIALVVVGPKDLPKLMRTIGRWTAKAREMADQFRRSFDEMSREAELDELRKEIAALRGQHPLAEMEHEMAEPILPPEYLAKPPTAKPTSEPSPKAPPSDNAATSAQ
jgi:sec-independent protein translocase protein TatB